ncbi:hypothetical protein [Micromonospora coerulea]|uniref:hypothetical protein n=1 Tax=Micromonospora coerulea TaxID=47856 RepID=UPI0031FA3B87
MITAMSVPVVTDQTGRRAWRAAVPTLVSWLALAGSYYVVLPVFDVLSAVTWALAWLSWLTAVLGPAHGAVGLARSQKMRLAAASCAALAVIALSMVGFPARTPDDLYQRHRGGLDRLAADY